MTLLPPVSAPGGFRGFVASLADQVRPKPGPEALGGELSPDAKRVVAQLKAIDAKVRAHEAAHLAAAGGVAKGGASYTYQRGPDGKQYAVGGEVPIDTSDVPGDPKATLAKAEQIQKAALAPSDPSSQDRAVAAAAASMAAKASMELARERWKSGPSGEEAQRPEALLGQLLDLLG